MQDLFQFNGTKSQSQGLRGGWLIQGAVSVPMFEGKVLKQRRFWWIYKESISYSGRHLSLERKGKQVYFQANRYIRAEILFVSIHLYGYYIPLIFHAAQEFSHIRENESGRCAVNRDFQSHLESVSGSEKAHNYSSVKSCRKYPREPPNEPKNRD